MMRSVLICACDDGDMLLIFFSFLIMFYEPQKFGLKAHLVQVRPTQIQYFFLMCSLLQASPPLTTKSEFSKNTIA